MNQKFLYLAVALSTLLIGLSLARFTSGHHAFRQVRPDVVVLRTGEVSGTNYFNDLQAVVDECEQAQRILSPFAGILPDLTK